MQNRINKTESAFFHRTLSGLTSSYVGHSAVLDLVNESIVCGRIDEVDG